MIPCELKCDNEGLLYLKDDSIFRRPSLSLDKREGIDEYYQSVFYSIESTDEYIIKYNCTSYTKKQIIKIKEMLANLVDKQKDITTVDFPIAYFVYMKRLSGLIIKYYKEGISFDNVVNLQDLEYIGKYYYHNEDSIHNLFILYNELLDIVNELFDNGIYYTDLNPGNIVLDDNKVKLIDFDYCYVHFSRKDERLIMIINSYLRFVKETLYCLKLYNYIDNHSNFDDTKKYLKTLENKVRKG